MQHMQSSLSCSNRIKILCLYSITTVFRYFKKGEICEEQKKNL